MLRASRFLGLVLILSAFLSAVVGPVGAASTVKLQLEAGSHELVVDGERLVVDTDHALVIQFQARDGLIKGIMEAADRSDQAHVRIVLLGPPDLVIYDGEVSDPTEFEADADETGHTEL